MGLRQQLRSGFDLPAIEFTGTRDTKVAPASAFYSRLVWWENAPARVQEGRVLSELERSTRAAKWRASKWTPPPVRCADVWPPIPLG